MVENIGTKMLETERLVLRRFTKEDAEKVYASWVTDAETTKYLTWEVHDDFSLTKSIVDSWVDAYSKEEFCYNWIVELKDTKEVIGNIAARDFSIVDESCEVAYCYSSKYFGKGYATEALKKVINFFFEDVNLHTITAYHIGGNIASGKVMEKSGMQKVAVIPERKYNKVTKKLDDEVIYFIANRNFK